MSDTILERISALADKIAAEGMVLRAADVRAGAVEIARLRAELREFRNAAADELIKKDAEIKRLWSVLKIIAQGAEGMTVDIARRALKRC